MPSNAGAVARQRRCTIAGSDWPEMSRAPDVFTNLGEPRLPDEAETRGQSSGAGDLDSSGEVSIRWKKPDPLLDRGFDLLAAVQQRECLAGTPLIEQIGIVSALRISRLAGAVHGQ